MEISTELTITLTSYLPRTLVVTSQTAFIVIILVVKLRRTVSQFMWQRLASLSCGTFVNLRTRSYQFLNVARSNGLICIIMFFSYCTCLCIKNEGCLPQNSAEGFWDL